MSAYVFAPAAVPSVAISDRLERFAVHRIYCVGRNYADHALEMGFDPKAEPPFFFTKPADAIVADGATVPYPSRTQDFHYEAELVVAIGRAGRAASTAEADTFIYGYAVGNDFTRRDLQAQARKAGRPWDVSKGFDHSAGIGPIHPRAVVGPLNSGRLWLRLNGEPRQAADISQLIWGVAEIIVELSAYYELAPGDLIYTGTPAGVGALRVGDEVVAGIDGLGEIRHRIGAPL